MCKTWDFSGGAVVKHLTVNAGDTGLTAGLERARGTGNDNLLQFSSLENSMESGAWQATVHGVTKSLTRLQSTAQSI